MVVVMSHKHADDHVIMKISLIRLISIRYSKDSVCSATTSPTARAGTRHRTRGRSERSGTPAGDFARAKAPRTQNKSTRGRISHYRGSRCSAEDQAENHQEQNGCWNVQTWYPLLSSAWNVFAFQMVCRGCMVGTERGTSKRQRGHSNAAELCS